MSVRTSTDSQYEYKQKNKILFVCLGNICRSPAAEGIFRTIVERNDAGDDLIIAMDDSNFTDLMHLAPSVETSRKIRKSGWVKSHEVTATGRSEIPLIGGAGG